MGGLDIFNSTIRTQIPFTTQTQFSAVDGGLFLSSGETYVLNFTQVRTMSDKIMVKWKSFWPQDYRDLLGFMVLYKEA